MTGRTALAVELWCLVGRARRSASPRLRAELRELALAIGAALAHPDCPPAAAARDQAREALYGLLDAATDAGVAWSDLAAWVNTYARQRPGREV